MKNLISILFLLLLSVQLHAQWVEKSEGISSGADVRYLEIYPNLVFAGTSSGVYVSDNDGDTWDLESEIGTSDFRAVASSPGFIYAANTNRVLRKNLQTSVWDTLLQPGEVGALAVSGNLINAGRKNGGVFRSENLGQDWTSLEQIPNSPSGHRALLAFGDTILSGTDGDGVYRSTDRGNTWETVNDGDLNPNGDDIRTLTKTGSTLFLSTGTNGIFRSVDKGLTWQAVNSGITNLNSRGLTAVDNKVYAGFNSGGGVFQSLNLGNSWTDFTGEIPTNLEIRTLATNGIYLYAGCQAGHIFRTTIGIISTQPTIQEEEIRLHWNREKGEIRFLNNENLPTDISVTDILGRKLNIHITDDGRVNVQPHTALPLLLVTATLSNGFRKTWRVSSI